jgi:SAM-dependent methyltransferase
VDPAIEAGALQRRYYAETAHAYDEMHDRDEHLESLRHIVHYLRTSESTSVLDTGCGTGLAMRYIKDALPSVEVHGNDPSEELIGVAQTRFGIPAEHLDVASSDQLPYADGEFDAVVETGVLHHVPDPNRIVSEMLRVARKAVFISDENAYGMGSAPARAAKLALRSVGLLEAVNRRRRGGNDWYYTEGDGVAWTYSVFDSVPQVEANCAEVIVLPVGRVSRAARKWAFVAASHCFLAGFKHPLPGGRVAPVAW